MNVPQELENLRDMKAEVQPLLDAIKTLESSIKREILDTGEIPEVEGVKVQIRKGSIRASYDTKALDGYAVANPDVLQFRKDKIGNPSVAISFK